MLKPLKAVELIFSGWSCHPVAVCAGEIFTDEAIVPIPDGNDGFTLVANILPEAWAEL